MNRQTDNSRNLRDSLMNRAEHFFKIGERQSYKIITVILIFQAAILAFTYYRLGIVYQNDTPSYVEPAKQFLLTGKFLDSEGLPILFRTPGYCVFLAIIYAVFDYSDTVVVLLQCLMVLATTWMIYYLTSEISGRKFCGCLASLFYICDFPIYTYAVSILTDSVFPFLLMTAFLLFYKYWVKKKLGYFTGSVLILNYAMLVRPQSLYYNMILMVVLLALMFLRRIGWKECLIYCSVFILAFGGWSLRNYYAHGEAMYTSIRAESYYKWYGPMTYSIAEGATEEESDEAFADMMKEKYPDYENLTKVEKVHAEKDIGWNYIKEHLPEYLWLNIQGLFKEMVGPGRVEIFDCNLPTSLSWMLCFAVAGILLLSYVIYAVGFLKTLTRQTWLDWLILLTVMYLMASTAVLGYSRFRLAFYPLCLVGTFSCWKKREREGNKVGIEYK